MIPYTEEAHGVFAFSLYEPRACVEMLKQVTRLEGWESARVRNEIKEGEFEGRLKPRVREASVLHAPEAAPLYREFEEKLDDSVKPLIKEVWRVELKEHSDTQLLRYGPGGHYQAHQDAALDLLDRYFTVICYLNDEFDGGRTHFPSLDYSAIPEPGKAILFPATYLHCGEPVTRGEKFLLLSWILGPVPIKWL